jgi:hypothetical protein
MSNRSSSSTRHRAPPLQGTSVMSASPPPSNTTTIQHIRGGPGAHARRVRSHHFPLYSHPMFRAAIHNSAAVRDALDTQLSHVDHQALDDALESLVEELLRQQNASTMADNNGEASPAPAVSEAQLLSLLANVTRVPAAATRGTSPPVPSSMTLKAGPTLSGPSPSLGSNDKAPPTPSFTPSASLKGRRPPHATRHLHPPQALPTPTAISELHSSDDAADNGVHVVSVNSLQKAVRAYTRRASQTTTASSSSSPAAPQSRATVPTAAPPTSRKPHGDPLTISDGASPGLVVPSSPSVAAAASPLCDPTFPSAAATITPLRFQPSSQRRKRLGHGVVAAAAAALAHPPPAITTSLYSLLPASSVRQCSGNLGGAAEAAMPIASGTVAHNITFAEMDRRPGVGTGPVAQQSVDTNRLHAVSDSVFAAMDVLMDGNSCCVRRRKRGPTQSYGIDRGGVASHLTLLRQQDGYASTSSPYAMNNHALLPPPSRTAAEAKARRILEAQRRQRHQLKPLPNPSITAHRSQYSIGHYPSPGRREGPATGEMRDGHPNAPLPSLSAVRGMASDSLFKQAVHSAHQYTGLYR